MPVCVLEGRGETEGEIMAQATLGASVVDRVNVSHTGSSTQRAIKCAVIMIKTSCMPLKVGQKGRGR